MNSQDEGTLSERFHEYFSVRLATSPEDKQSVYRIRYRVYCDEFKFLRAEENPDELEIDDYDDFSQLCIITHKSSGLPAACVRVIPAVGPNGDWKLPYEKLGSGVLDEDFVNSLDVPRGSLCEISRLAVDGAFRRRSGETATRFGELKGLDITQREERTFGLISVATFLSSAAAADLFDRSGAFAMMEPFLPRLMQRSGIDFTRAGLDVDYHGIRAPYFIRMDTFLENMHAELKDFYQSIYNCITESA